jgi:hypothetical protein
MFVCKHRVLNHLVQKADPPSPMLVSKHRVLHHLVQNRDGVMVAEHSASPDASASGRDEDPGDEDPGDEDPGDDVSGSAASRTASRSASRSIQDPPPTWSTGNRVIIAFSAAVLAVTAFALTR